MTPPNRPHNSLYVISNKGQVVDRYDKRFCSNTEITRFYSPGFEPVVFDIDGFVFGCVISGLIGPDGGYLVQVSGRAELVVGELDRETPELNGALNLAGPWRASAMEGGSTPAAEWRTHAARTEPAGSDEAWQRLSVGLQRVMPWDQ